MLKILIKAAVLAALAALAMTPGIATAQAGEDSVVGRVFGFPEGTVYFASDVDAHSGPSGENPSGSVNYQQGTPAYTESLPEGRVTCLAVSGNRAVVGGFGLRSVGGYSFPPEFPPPPPADAGFYLLLVDNGQPVPGQDLGPDEVAFKLGGTQPPTDCGTVALPAPTPFFAGDVTVTDAPAIPTTRAECRNGAWRTFAPMFNNQGQCIAFVEPAPRP